MVSAFGDRDWQVFSRFIGKDSWGTEERFSTPMKRWENSDEIDQYVEEWTRQCKIDDLFHRLQANAIAAAPVNTSKDIVNSPQLQARGFFAEVEHPKAGKLKYPTASYKFSESALTYKRPAPLLSQHNEEVYCGRIGYSKEELAKLAEVGII
jgi:crotonobetainyl-CoA:carnitine CoA-transferase CaiB-like acyl-CoA transferase